MAKKKVKRTVKKKSSGLFKFLEVIVLIGAVAGVLMKVFQGKSKKKK